MSRLPSVTSAGLLLAALSATTGDAVAQYAIYQQPQYVPGQPYQAGPAVQPGGFTYAANGTQFGGVTRGDTTSGYYTDGQGNAGNGYVRYGNNAALGGAYQTGNGTSASGYVSGSAGQVQYQSPGSGSWGGQYQVGSGNVAASGYSYDQYGNGYNGGFASQGGVVQAQGEVRRPGYVPGTQDRIGGGATYAGQNSAANGYYQVYDATGRYRFAGAGAGLNRNQYTQAANMGVGPAQAGYNGAVTFQGVNSQVAYGQNVQARGLGGYSYGVQAGHGNFGGNASVGVGSYNVGGNAGVNQHGLHGQVTAPHVNMPQVSMPHVSTPHLSMPSTSGISMPAFRSPF